MSGGTFDYMQFQIRDAANALQKIIDNNGKIETIIESGCEYKYRHDYYKTVITEFEKGLRFLRIAEIYLYRIDWLVSGDDGEDTFLKRLKEELKELESKNYRNDLYEE